MDLGDLVSRCRVVRISNLCGEVNINQPENSTAKAPMEILNLVSCTGVTKVAITSPTVKQVIHVRDPSSTSALPTSSNIPSFSLQMKLSAFLFSSIACPGLSQSLGVLLTAARTDCHSAIR